MNKRLKTTYIKNFPKIVRALMISAIIFTLFVLILTYSQSFAENGTPIQAPTTTTDGTNQQQNQEKKQQSNDIAQAFQDIDYDSLSASQEQDEFLTESSLESNNKLSKYFDKNQDTDTSNAATEESQLSFGGDGDNSSSNIGADLSF